MAVDRRITGTETPAVEMESVDIETPNEDIEAIAMQEDGSAIVNPENDIPELSFDSNLADFVDEDELGVIASDLIGDYKADQGSRDEWFQSYRKGLNLLGFKYEERTMPFAGSSGVTHPLLSESVTQFQAQAYKELLPAGGPVRTEILGTPDPDKEQQSQRVRDYMNYQIMHVMEELSLSLLHRKI